MAFERHARRSSGVGALYWLLALVCAPIVVWGEDESSSHFVVRSAEIVQVEKIYRLSAVVDYRFSAPALEALHNGVPLVVELVIEIDRPREYVWNETVATLRQRYQLEFEALTNRYGVTNLNSGAQSHYPTRAMAIASMGHVFDIPILDADLLDPEQSYTARLQASLDLNALPVPLRLIGYFSAAWRVSSEWYTWTLR